MTNTQTDGEHDVTKVIMFVREKERNECVREGSQDRCVYVSGG